MSLNEQEIFEKLKEALDYEYLCTDFGGKEVTNLEEYLYAIKMERSLDKEFDQIAIDTHKTYVEFINYLAEKAIGYKDYIIETFNNNEHNKFIGYLKTKKIIINDKLFLEFEVDGCKLKSEWCAGDNYAVWQQCGACGDDYTGYLLFPTYNSGQLHLPEGRCLCKNL